MKIVIVSGKNSEAKWCECQAGRDFTLGWCVQTSLGQDRRHQYVRIQNDLLEQKNKLSGLDKAEGGSQFLMFFTQFTLLMCGSLVMLAMVIIFCKKCSVFFKNFRSK